MLNMTDETTQGQARAIREQAEKRSAPRNETAREARWRVERERAEAQAKREPHKRY